MDDSERTYGYSEDIYHGKHGRDAEKSYEYGPEGRGAARGTRAEPRGGGDPHRGLRRAGRASPCRLTPGSTTTAAKAEPAAPRSSPSPGTWRPTEQGRGEGRAEKAASRDDEVRDDSARGAADARCLLRGRSYGTAASFQGGIMKRQTRVRLCLALFLLASVLGLGFTGCGGAGGPMLHDVRFPVLLVPTRPVPLHLLQRGLRLL